LLHIVVVDDVDVVDDGVVVVILVVCAVVPESNSPQLFSSGLNMVVPGSTTLSSIVSSEGGTKAKTGNLLQNGVAAAEPMDWSTPSNVVRKGNSN